MENGSTQMGQDVQEWTLFGQKVRITGRESIYLFLTIVALIAVGYMLWATTVLLRQDITAQHAEIYRQHESLGRTMERLVETMAEQNYIITLPNEKRESLNLNMPASLRDKVGKVGGPGGRP